METLRPFLTTDQLDWAESVGVSAKRAYWLASCPKNTRCGIQNRPERVNINRPNRYLWKSSSGVWRFRVKRKDCTIERVLTNDLNQSRVMRDILENQLGIKSVYKFQQ